MPGPKRGEQEYLNELMHTLLEEQQLFLPSVEDGLSVEEREELDKED